MWVRKVVWPGLRPLRTLFVHSQIKKTNFKSHFLNYGILSEECAQVLSSREKYLTMPLDKKRELYKADYLQLKDILTWPELYEKEHHRLKSQYDQYFKDKSVDGGYPVNQDLNKKISIICGDITTLEIDAIVNAANNSLLGGGGVDGAIHKAAGPELVNECRMRNGCKTGECELTGGYLLPAKYVIHTVGPKGEKPDLLKSCYRKCLEKARSENIRTIAFPCISTGIYGYPQQEAALVALRVVRSYLEENPASFDRIIFCTFLEDDRTIYETLMQLFFPLA